MHTDFRLYRVILLVSDIENAVEFYTQLFRSEGIRVSAGRHYFDLAGTILAVYDPVSDGDNQGEWKYHENQYIYIAVQVLEEVMVSVEHLGGIITQPITHMPWGERLFYALDPFNNPICFVQKDTLFKGYKN